MADEQQKEIAEALGVNQKTFNGWCTGLSMPKTVGESQFSRIMEGSAKKARKSACLVRQAQRLKPGKIIKSRDNLDSLSF